VGKKAINLLRKPMVPEMTGKFNTLTATGATTLSGNVRVTGSLPGLNNILTVGGFYSVNPNILVVQENASAQPKIGIGKVDPNDLSGTLHVATGLDQFAVMIESTDNIVGFSLKDPSTQWNFSTTTSDTGPANGFTIAAISGAYANNLGAGGYAPRLSIDRFGQIGIGTKMGLGTQDAADDGIVPDALMHLSSSLSSSGEFMSGQSGRLFRIDGVDQATNTVNTHILFVTGSGQVGIGTNAPSEALDVNSDAIRIRTSQTPSSDGDTGTAGMICWDANYIYVCVAIDTWKRATLATGW